MSLLKRLLAPALVAGLVFSTIAVAQDTKKPAKKPAAKKTEAAAGESNAMTFEIYADKGGKFRWRLIDANNYSLAQTPRGYASKDECRKAVEAVKSFASKAAIKEAAAGDAEK